MKDPAVDEVILKDRDVWLCWIMEGTDPVGSERSGGDVSQREKHSMSRSCGSVACKIEKLLQIIYSVFIGIAMMMIGNEPIFLFSS